ncbi:diguanylate cyclase [Reinekea sp. G2M2-21]|uniref:sensor domain-containing diguanylate cyclase n=1 Tax=Reinekea sp. G2M2-21 TaxID=2788942 RepID=UPI0018AAD3D3|nr:diguanylate cyclase [Reinekea sp. G2M2-21]
MFALKLNSDATAAFRNVRVGQSLWVAITYVICARIGQMFAIDPANVTPVWIPSGILLAVALRLGPQIWPGIFLGAFTGNIWAYFSTDSLTRMLAAVASATLNGIGDVISIVVMAQLIVHLNRSNRILNSHQSLAIFIVFGAFVGPFISALFGATGLLWFGHIESEAYRTVMQTWLLGDSTGVIIFTPFLLSWLYPEEHFTRRTLFTLIVVTAYAMLITGVIFDILRLPKLAQYGLFLFLPALFYALIHLGQRLVFSVQVAALSLAVVATALNKGPFYQADPHSALIYLQLFAAIFSLVLFVFAILNMDKSRSSKLLQRRTLELEELYRKDALTKLWNRYRIKEFMDLEMIRYRRDKRPFGLLLLDIDDFKRINDEHGHLTGDKVLIELSQFVQSRIREVDFLGRWGGEEFIIIVSETSAEAILLLAEKLQTMIREHNFESIQPRLTVSIGVSLVNETDTELTLMDRVDSALYQAKNKGKDQVIFVE